MDIINIKRPFHFEGMQCGMQAELSICQNAGDFKFRDGNFVRSETFFYRFSVFRRLFNISVSPNFRAFLYYFLNSKLT